MAENLHNITQLREIFDDIHQGYGNLMLNIPKDLHSLYFIDNKIKIDKNNFYNSKNKLINKYDYNGSYDSPDIDLTYNNTKYSFIFHNTKNKKASYFFPEIFILKRNDSVVIRTEIIPSKDNPIYMGIYCDWSKYYRYIFFQEFEYLLDISRKDNVYKIDNKLLTDLADIGTLIFNRKEKIVEEIKNERE